jgi:hypothetical protein
MTQFAVYNPELNRLLTNAAGNSVFPTLGGAAECLREFGCQSHLQIVPVEPGIDRLTEEAMDYLRATYPEDY